MFTGRKRQNRFGLSETKMANLIRGWQGPGKIG